MTNADVLVIRDLLLLNVSEQCGLRSLSTKTRGWWSVRNVKCRRAPQYNNQQGLTPHQIRFYHHKNHSRKVILTMGHKWLRRPFSISDWAVCLEWWAPSAVARNVARTTRQRPLDIILQNITVKLCFESCDIDLPCEDVTCYCRRVSQCNERQWNSTSMSTVHYDSVKRGRIEAGWGELPWVPGKSGE